MEYIKVRYLTVLKFQGFCQVSHLITRILSFFTTPPRLHVASMLTYLVAPPTGWIMSRSSLYFDLTSSVM